jgi:hypothetical protein
VRQVFLRPESTQYIIDYLSHSTTLMQLALSGRDPAHGTVSTYIPLDLDVTSERLHQFEWSLHAPPVLSDETLHNDAAGNRVHVTPVETMDHLLVQVIQKHLHADQYRVCIFDAGERLSGDKGFGNIGDARLLEHGAEGYFLLTSDDAARPDHIRRTIHTGTSWLLTGILSSTEGKVPITNEKVAFTTKELKLLASATTAIIVGAYDEEGFLVWQFLQQNCREAQQ